jgi:hypothetical protein
MGFAVRLNDIFPQTIEAIRAAGGIQVDSAVNGFGKSRNISKQVCVNRLMLDGF